MQLNKLNLTEVARKSFLLIVFPLIYQLTIHQHNNNIKSLIDSLISSS
jgi:hypothetical protein